MTEERGRVLLIGSRAGRGVETGRRLAPGLFVEAMSLSAVSDEDGGETEGYDAVLLDAESHAEGRAGTIRCALASLRSRDPSQRILVLVPDDDTAAARAALDAGAWDVIASTAKPEEIAARLRAAAALRAREAQPSEGETGAGAIRAEPHGTVVWGPLTASPGFAAQEVIGSSEAIRRVFGLLRRLAVTDVPVLITGESGTGKELAARAIHERSTRSQAPFVPISCAAMPENLLESELFGVEKGAFTGATRSRAGRIEAAHGGTLFLDEIAELAPGLQVKLLRFLEERSVQHLGGHRDIPVDVRVVAATNRDLDQELAAGRFREDLYYRIAVFTLHMPPLREREGDVILLAQAFLAREASRNDRPLRGFTPEAIAAISRARWPGNVRQLLNSVRRAALVAERDLVEPGDLGLEECREEVGPTLQAVRSEAESRAVRAALQRAGGNKSEAARLLSISRTQLYEIMRRHRIPDA